jgi:hypothetical protein
MVTPVLLRSITVSAAAALVTAQAAQIFMAKTAGVVAAPTPSV